MGTLSWFKVAGLSMAFGASAGAQCIPRTYAPLAGSRNPIGGLGAFVVWDPDGPGPLPDKLVIVGSLSGIGETSARGVLVGDPWSSWSCMDGGRTGTTPETACNAAGQLFRVSRGAAFRWDGAAWAPIASPSFTPDRMAVWNGRPVVYSSTRAAGLVECFDGTAWTAVGGAFPGATSEVCEASGVLYARVGAVVYAWTGAAWSDVTPVLSSGAGLMSMAPFGGELYLGGRFSTVAGQPADSLARRTPAGWRGVVGLGAGVEIARLAADAAGLYLANRPQGSSGRFQVSRYTGGAFTTVVPAASGPTSIASLTPFAGGVVMAPGTFGEQRLSDGTVVSAPAYWRNQEGRTLSPLGLPWTPTGMAYAGDTLYTFHDSLDLSETSLLRHAGAGVWESIPEVRGAVHWISTSPSGLYVGGSLWRPDSNLGGIMLFDGAGWSFPPIAPFVGGLGLLESSSGLVIHGWYGQEFNLSIRRRTPGGGWETLAATAEGVTALKEFDGLLIAEGSHPVLDGVMYTTVAAWNGRSWARMSPSDAPAYDLAVWRGSLYGVLNTTLAKWENGLWVDAGLWNGAQLDRLWNLSGTLFVATNRHEIHRLDGSAWTRLPMTTVPFVTAGTDGRAAVSSAIRGACGETFSLVGEYTCGCPSDFNGDGFLDFFDYTDFLACFVGETCTDPLDADFNGDGFTDFFDYSDFVAAFEAGC